MAPSQNGPGQEGIKFNQCAGIIFHETEKAEGDRGSIERMSAAGAASTIPQENSDMNVLCAPDQPLKSAWFPAPSRAVLSVWVTGQSRCREVCCCLQAFIWTPHACFHSSSCIERDPDSCTRLEEVGVFQALQSLDFETKLFYPRLIAMCYGAMALFCFDNRLFILTFK